MDNYSKDQFMEQVEDSITKIYPKDVVKGTIIYVTDTEVMVNIGYRADGIIKLDELSTDENAKPKDLFKEGQEIDVYIIKLDDGEGNVVLSTRRVEGLKNWEALVEKYNNNETVEAKIKKEVKGGLLATVSGIKRRFSFRMRMISSATRRSSSREGCLPSASSTLTAVSPPSPRTSS